MRDARIAARVREVDVVDKVAVIGSGLIGRAWAISFSRAGHEVALYDAVAGAAQAALGFVNSVLADLHRNGLLNGHEPGAVRERIGVAADLADALRDAVHVQENTPERLETKIEVFRELDRLAAPRTVLASSTSALLPSKFTETLPGRGRCLVVHPINPPYLVPAVEVVPAPWTDPAVMQQTGAFMRAAGHAPIMMQKEIDGFVMNRLQGALLQEAFRLVAEGYADTEDVDIGIRDGLGLRWSFMGPFETIDLNAPSGVADYIARYEGLYKTLWQTQQHIVPWSGELSRRIDAERRRKLAAEQLPGRASWRDRRLMGLVAHKRAADTKNGS
jgi:3-hydroxyacyl-CoA dehydrogenase